MMIFISLFSTMINLEQEYWRKRNLGKNQFALKIFDNFLYKCAKKWSLLTFLD